mmetsp:Transcript_35606/g.80433  ORF Transcript_35606/g.80433 Transcript_35606/m.80433 type:complete len:202 (-) Transcript_35606:58-663(-)
MRSAGSMTHTCVTRMCQLVPAALLATRPAARRLRQRTSTPTSRYVPATTPKDPWSTLAAVTVEAPSSPGTARRAPSPRWGSCPGAMASPTRTCSLVSARTEIGWMRTLRISSRMDRTLLRKTGSSRMRKPRRQTFGLKTIRPPQPTKRPPPLWTRQRQTHKLPLVHFQEWAPVPTDVDMECVFTELIGRNRAESPGVDGED